MPPDAAARVLQVALDQMGYSPDSLGPSPLMEALGSASRQLGCVLDGSNALAELAEAMVSGDPNGLLSSRWGRALREWDHAEDAGWVSQTRRHTRDRRDRIYALLAMSDVWNKCCDQWHPPRLADFSEVPVIAIDWVPWYRGVRRTAHEFYWPRFQDYLRSQRWKIESIQDLDRDSTEVVNRLADPEASEAYVARGLVVGYVQSGKTANFTAVIAKAADAGYRLIVILAGTLDILRNQTQRRLDKELIGRELIETHPNEDGRHDYWADADWAEFVSHGALPRELGGFNWRRLTTAAVDYRSLRAGIEALEFRPVMPGRRYNDPAHLHADDVRLLVVKKIPAVLKHVTRDLGRLRTQLSGVPALIIDDESDLASVNTLPPRGGSAEEKQRTKTNAAITELLKTLPRGQYVGYTATPAASVLMDSRDDLFPRDFIIPLPKPSGYMGVAEFFDPDGAPEVDQFREKAFVRHVEGSDTDDGNLRLALDCFVVAGCVKLFREDQGPDRFRHHTMLVHRSHQIKAHETDRELVSGLFNPGEYVSDEGMARLRRVFENDFLVAADVLVRAGRDAAVGQFPPVSQLKDLISRFFERVHPERVLVANGDPKNRERAPNFDLGPLWAVVVGGTKLSRGYTVEGLTISYYRRPVASSDTLMQMGRWFGFRRGYQDLVRVFLGREQRRGKPALDLYEEFRACCNDEEAFRKQLAQYAGDSDHPLRPKDVPPLVYCSGLLTPTAMNKLHYARRIVENPNGRYVERTLAPTRAADIESNWAAFSLLVSQANASRRTLDWKSSGGGRGEIPALVGVAGRAETIAFLKAYKWTRAHVLDAVVGFLEGVTWDSAVDDWLIFMPQRKDGAPDGRHAFADLTTDVRTRSRIGAQDERYKVFSEPEHVEFSKWASCLESEIEGVGQAVGLRRQRRAVLGAYACKDERESRVNLGFFLQMPSNNLTWKVRYQTNHPE